MNTSDSVPVLLDSAGRRRSPATMPGFNAGRPPRNKGRSYPADPPRVEEIIAVMRTCGTNHHGLRMRALIVVLWRAGLRISEALALAETDLDARRGSLTIRHGKGNKRREVGMARGHGTTSSNGSPCGSPFQSALSSASSTAPTAAERGQ